MFTLESLVTRGQWTAAQNSSRKKAGAKTGGEKKSQQNTADTAGRKDPWPSKT